VRVLMHTQHQPHLLIVVTTGRGFDIAYETPKSESLSLFHLGERSYDHVLLLPTKSKGLYLPPSALLLQSPISVPVAHETDWFC
jgi:hypothetical protein